MESGTYGCVKALPTPERSHCQGASAEDGLVQVCTTKERANCGVSADALHRRKRLSIVLGFGLIGVLVLLIALITTLRAPHNRGSSSSSSDNHDNVPANCATPFGAPLGSVFGVTAFSNCNGDYTSNADSWEQVKKNPAEENSAVVRVFTGMKWQCVEYARRALILTRGMTFESVEGASDIFSLRSAQSATNESDVLPFVSYPNGNTTEAPRAGDLLIYPVQPGGFPFGHVALVVDATATALMIAEQNWDQRVWTQPTFARELRLERDLRTGRWKVIDERFAISGWKRVESG